MVTMVTLNLGDGNIPMSGSSRGRGLTPVSHLLRERIAAMGIFCAVVFCGMVMLVWGVVLVGSWLCVGISVFLVGVTHF